MDLIKSCPKCSRTYSDITMNYCLADGSFLSAPQTNPQATLVLDVNINPTMLPLNISIHKGEVYINNKLVKLPTTLDELESLLGETSRSNQQTEAAIAHYWDNIGIYSIENIPSFEIDVMGIILNRIHPKGKLQLRRTFKGQLYVDATLVNDKSTVKFINDTKSGKPFTSVSPENVSWKLNYENRKINLITDEQQVIVFLTVIDERPTE